jgi:hypothetical protein
MYGNTTIDNPYAGSSKKLKIALKPTIKDSMKQLKCTIDPNGSTLWKVRNDYHSPDRNFRSSRYLTEEEQGRDETTAREELEGSPPGSNNKVYFKDATQSEGGSEHPKQAYHLNQPYSTPLKPSLKTT